MALPQITINETGIFPNPLNSIHFIFINSGFTCREFDYLNNSRQSPKLPDLVIVDISVPVSARTPGGIENAGFFDEAWKLAHSK